MFKRGINHSHFNEKKIKSNQHYSYTCYKVIDYIQIQDQNDFKWITQNFPMPATYSENIVITHHCQVDLVLDLKASRVFSL